MLGWKTREGGIHSLDVHGILGITFNSVGHQNNLHVYR